MVKNFEFTQTDIDDLQIIQPFIAEDERGYFSKYYEKGVFSNYGIDLTSFEENQSQSKKGVIRGMHFQTTHWQSKLIRAVRGEVFDVAVDLRKGSPSFGKWKGMILSEENRTMFFIPEGFAHGFLALSEIAVISYICGDRYDPDTDGGIRWNDPDLSIAWPLETIDKIIVSSKDQALPSFSEYMKGNMGK